MKNSKKTYRLLISAILMTTLIFSQIFMVYGESPSEYGISDTEKVEELTEQADSDAKYDGYIVKVEDGKTNKVDEDEVEKYDPIIDNEYVVVDEPEDALDFVEPEYIDYIEPNYLRYSFNNVPSTRQTATEGAVTEEENDDSSNDSDINAAPDDDSIKKQIDTIPAADKKSEISTQESNIQEQSSAYNGWNNNLYNLINVKSAWDQGVSGTGIKIAVFDSGLNVNHNGFGSSKVKEKINFVGSYGTGKNYTNTNVTDTLGHGTVVSSLAAGKTNSVLGWDYKDRNYKYLPYRGIAYNSNVSSCKVLSGAYGSVGDFIQALRYYEKYNPDVINMSLGGLGYSKTEYNFLQKYINKGTIAIAAVGNEGEEGSPINYPANYANVIGVGSIEPNKRVSSFSNKNNSVMLTAPGSEVYGLSNKSNRNNELYSYNSGGYTYYVEFGTSFSSPIVAGAAALVKEAYGKNINQSQFLTLIKEMNSQRYNKSTGYGLLNVGKVVERAKTRNVPKSYKIVYNTAGGKILGNITTIHKAGTSLVLPRSLTRTGYTFNGWVDETGKRITSIPASSTRNKTLKAIWKGKNYKLKFYGNKGKVKSKSKTVTYGSAISTMKTASRKGYNFLGWFSKKKGGTQYYKGKTYKTAANKKLYAQWTKKKVAKFNANKGTVSKYAKVITKGKKIGSLPTPKRSGYRFKGWYTKKSGGKKVTKGTRIAKNKSMTLYARWSKK